ncbi:hypothetical protein TVAG_164220 [Trichomonas vaginalis G3]|uniref:Uncharacterized protein n=1 Tax=Trichomonas vaginalis (strain ATCC PRA-98 / G3) TaxID=412133 RepID=A2E1W4_TRIV3|nr:hypothetical protein TVAGG3_0036530 [Trichomonas vaginalis G3]EAY13313.1 hypothetical protein TVAG_164220 [Trichomonas vaginalis G3]KAI5540420.1 hypothetical protein TVAGG3_0036530 [Trichomonas vaginalis G3]|eukprot:XP_001325536.1 hypothetical protein [Trichomonas vaginalis G3]
MEILISNCIFSKCYSNIGPACMEITYQGLLPESRLTIDSCHFSLCYSAEIGGIASLAPYNCLIQKLCCSGCKSHKRANSFFAYIGNDINFTENSLDKCGPKTAPGETELMMLYGGLITCENNNLTRNYCNELRAFGCFRPAINIIYKFNDHVNSSAKSLFAFFGFFRMQMDISKCYVIKCSILPNIGLATYEYMQSLIIQNFYYVDTNDEFSFVSVLDVAANYGPIFIKCFTNRPKAETQINGSTDLSNDAIYMYSYNSTRHVQICSINTRKPTKILLKLNNTKNSFGKFKQTERTCLPIPDENVEVEGQEKFDFFILSEIGLVLLIVAAIVLFSLIYIKKKKKLGNSTHPKKDSPDSPFLH